MAEYKKERYSWIVFISLVWLLCLLVFALFAIELYGFTSRAIIGIAVLWIITIICGYIILKEYDEHHI